MGYGSIMTQPGYTGSPRSLMGSKSTGSSGGYGGGSAPPGKGVGFSTYKPSVGPKWSGSASTIPSSGSPGGGWPNASNANINIPPPQQYSPNTYSDPNLKYMSDQAKGLMDPNSDYYKRLSAGMQGQIGNQAAAQERSAALRGAWSGLGGGQGAEVMQTAADIGQAGLEAQGSAEADLRLAAPQLGMQGLQSTFQPQLGYNQLNEGSSQFGASLGENQRQFGVNAAIQQQGMANQAGQFNASQQQQWAMQQQQNEWNQMMQEMAQSYM